MEPENISPTEKAPQVVPNTPEPSRWLNKKSLRIGAGVLVLLIVIAGWYLFFLSTNHFSGNSDGKTATTSPSENVSDDFDIKSYSFQEEASVFRNPHINLFFKYPAEWSLEHQITDNSTWELATFVCDGPAPGPQYAYWEACNANKYATLIALEDASHTPAVDIVLLHANNGSIDYDDGTLQKYTLQQFFNGHTFEKRDDFPITNGFTDPDVRQGQYYVSTGEQAGEIQVAFAGRNQHNGGIYLFVLRNPAYAEEFKKIVGSIEVLMPALGVHYDLSSGEKKTVPLPFEASSIAFHDIHENLLLLSHANELYLFDRQFNMIAKHIFEKEDQYYPEITTATFDSTNPAIVNVIIGRYPSKLYRGVFAEGSIGLVYDGPLLKEPYHIYPSIGTTVTVASAYGDAGCAATGYAVVDFEKDTTQKGFSYSWCSEEMGGQTVFGQGVTDDGRTVFFVRKNDTTGIYELFSHDNLTNTEKVIATVGADFSERMQRETGMISGHELLFYSNDVPMVYNHETGVVTEVSNDTLRKRYFIEPIHAQSKEFRGFIGVDNNANSWHVDLALDKTTLLPFSTELLETWAVDSMGFYTWE